MAYMKTKSGRRLDRFNASEAPSMALMPFRAAVANRENARCVWYALGDSITEGANSTARPNRWVNQTLASLRNRRPTSGIGTGGSLGSLPPYFDGSTMGNPFTTLSGAPSPGKETSFGLGRRTATMSGTAKYVFDINGSSFDMFYTSGPTSGTIGVKIDAGSVQNVATSGTLADGKKWNSGALTPGAHTVEITAVSGTVYFGGLYVYDGDESKGIHLLEAGHFGWKTTDWVANSPRWQDTITLHQPHLVTIALGANDYQNDVAPTTFKTNLQTLITAFRTNTTIDPAFVLVGYSERADIGTATHDWSDYLDAMYEIAEADAGVGVFDLSLQMIARRTDATNVYGLYGDQVHPSNKGHKLMGEGFADWLIRG